MKPAAFCILLLLHFSKTFTQDSIWYARTTGKLPFVEYGIGDDRLGGAKMTYLDSGILLKIVDSFKTDYKVQLSKFHSGYIAKESVVLIRKEANYPVIHNQHLSGSWRVFGDSVF